MPKHIVIFGATSEIGGEIATLLAAGNQITLAGRRTDALEQQAADLRSLGAAEVTVRYFDAADVDSHRTVVQQIMADAPIDLALAMFGVLGDQELAEHDGAEVARVLHTDFTAQAVLLTELTSALRTAGRPATVVAFSSIAGARVRRPNYVYGSAKAGLDGFAQGMQDALQHTNVRLLVVRPGFVIGRMTEGMKPAPMSSTPQHVARETVAAIKGSANDVWIPRRLRALAAIMPLVPRWLWRRAPR